MPLMPEPPVGAHGHTPRPATYPSPQRGDTPWQRVLAKFSGQGVEIFEATAGIKQHHTLLTIYPALLD